MAWYEVRGGRPLDGAVKIQGSKNGALPVLAGALLHRGRTVLHNCPGITDVGYTLEILRSLGCSVTVEKDALILDAAGLDRNRVPESLGEKMRSSVILLGSLLGRFGEACLPYPGGCTIGKRPIDLHLKMLSEMGVTFTEEERGLKASCRRLSGAEFSLPFPSVGATENVILAAVLAEGVTVLSGAAREPEIAELCRMLRGMGAKITGDQTGRIVIDGVKELFESTCEVGADRIVAATCLSAVAVCSGEITLTGVDASHLNGVIEPFEKMGCKIWSDKDTLTAARMDKLMAIPYLKTSPYPGFPTDVQSLIMAVMSFADGQSVVEEGIFEGRFRTAYQLQKMGAAIIIENNQAIIWGSHLIGTKVEAPDLRGGAALAIAGLGADGVTTIFGYDHIARGYEDLAGMLFMLGAQAALRE